MRDRQSGLYIENIILFNVYISTGAGQMGDVRDRREPSGSGSHRINIGLIVFIAIFIYMAANSILYFMRGHVSFFEVEQGEIVDEDKFNGFILRDEQAVKSSDSGYISFYVNDGEKAAKNENVCLINKSDSQSTTADQKDKVYSLTDADYSDIREQMLNFSKTFTDSDYSQLQNLRYRLGNVVNQIVSRNNIDTLNKKDSSTYKLISSTENGVISYTIDGMESYKEKDIKPGLFSSGDYQKKQIEAGTYINAKDPAYKIIYDDSWEIVIKPDSDQLARIKKIVDKAGDATPTIDVNFVSDGITAPASIKIFKNDGTSYVALELSNYMVRFCNDRYVDIDLVWDSYSGLKIPSSAIAQRNYYMIPAAYLVTDSDSAQKGFYVKGDSGTEFVKPDIALSNDDYCYVDCDDMKEGTVLINNDTGETYPVSTTSALNGVYNINQGYTKFCLVTVLYKYGDYSIVENASGSGLSLYDRIILDGSSVHNDEVVY